MTYNPKIKNVSSKVTKVDSEYLRADKIYLDLARDPSDTQDTSYEDGLFADFQQANRDSLDSGPEGITIGTAIDRFNEVLSGLAPPPAPKLSTLNSEESQGKVEKVAFGTVPQLKYNSDPNVTTREDLSQVENHNAYNKLSSGGHFIRLGMFAEKKQLQIVLNGTVQQNLQGDEENYPENSFNTTNTISPANLTVQMLDDNEQYTALSTDDYDIAIDPDPTSSPYNKRYGMFASGKVFEVFNSSTGILTLESSAPWRTGYNRLKIVSNQFGIETTVVEWVYVPNEDVTYSYTAPVIPSVTETEGPKKFISGIQYVTGMTYILPSSTTVGNYAVQSYPNNYGLEISSNTSAIPTKTSFGLTANQVNLLSNTLDISNLTVETSTNPIRDVELATPQLTVKVENLFGKSLDQNVVINLSKFLFDNFSEDPQPYHINKQAEFENFNNETRRVKTDTTSWDSSIPLGATDALVFNGSLGHSNRVGDLTSAQRPAAGPNYTSRSAREEYVRVFKHDQALNKIWMNVHCEGSISFTATEGSGVHVQFSKDGSDWRDAIKSTADFASLGAGTLLSGQNQAVRELEIDFANMGGVDANQNVYMKISFPSTVTGTITKLETKNVNTLDSSYNSSLS